MVSRNLVCVLAVLSVTACGGAPTFASVAAKVPELVQCPDSSPERAKELALRWLGPDRDLVEKELIEQLESGPTGAAKAVCQIKDVYALGEEFSEASARAKEALTQLKVLK